jgi:transposase
MLSFSSKQRYSLYGRPTDTCLPARLSSRQVRKGFSGLSGLVRQHLDHELLSGDVFIFINRRRDRIKLLMWDVTGFALYYKQLERGTFELPVKGEATSSELSWAELVMLLEGIELKSIKQRKRYRRSA